MGYRHYMYIVPREKVKDIKSITYKKLKDLEWPSLWEVIGDNQFFEFGKYYENAEEIQKLGTPLFENPDVNEFFEEYAPYVVEKDAVLCAIEDMRKRIIKWYDDLLMTQEEFDATHNAWESRLKQPDRIRRHLENQRDEWQNAFGIVAVNTDDESQTIVNSWLYEYEIFELAHQLKMMDWENNVLVFCGW